MAEQGSSDWVADLPRDEGVARLIRALSLSDRFHVYLLMCDTPRVAQAVLAVLVREVSAEREEEVRVVRLDPYEGRPDAAQPLAFERIADTVLGRLVAPAKEMRGSDVIVVVDASKALPEDDEAWALFFQRLNERRNVIAGRLRGPFLLCMPRRYEPVFAHAAPDFWSIRSLAVVVEAKPPVEAGLMQSPKLPILEEVPVRRGENEAQAIEAGIATARESLARDPEAPSALTALTVWLSKRFEYEYTVGTIDEAINTARELVALARRLVEQAPDRGPMLFALASVLFGMGETQFKRPDLDGAQSAYDEGLRILRHLLEREPNNTEWLHGLALGLAGIGRVHAGRRDLQRAVEALDEAVRAYRHLLEQEPARTEWMRDLAMTLGDIGHAYLGREEPDSALQAAEESLRIMRSLVKREPDRSEWRSNLATILNTAGRVHSARGDLDRALEAHEEALRIIGHLTERAPDQPDLLWDLADTLNAVGAVHSARGDLERALAALDEGLRIHRQLVARDRTRLSLRFGLLNSLARKAELVATKGRLLEALSLLREALVETESLRQGASAVPGLDAAAAELRANIARLEAATKPKRRRHKKR